MKASTAGFYLILPLSCIHMMQGKDQRTVVCSEQGGGVTIGTKRYSVSCNPRDLVANKNMVQK